MQPCYRIFTNESIKEFIFTNLRRLGEVTIKFFFQMFFTGTIGH